jgi:RND family efflux transporter MFP subunit
MQRGAWFGVAILPMASIAACSQEQTSTPDPLVRTVAYTTGDAGEVSYTGVVKARTESDLGFRVAGKIVERYVDAGTSVRAGQPLMRIDAADLGLAASGASDRVRAAAADAEHARADLARLRGLVEAGAISASQADAARAAAVTTAANLSAARAAARNAANELGYAILRADSDGVVVATLADAGQVVAAGTPVVRLARSGPREAAIDVPEALGTKLPATARATLYGGGSYEARLRIAAASADPQTRTFAARYVLNGTPVPPLGATITLAFSAPLLDTASASIPLAALLTRERGSGVFVVRGKTARFVPVRVVAYGNETARVATAAIRPGERIVALGVQLLRDGQRVRLAVPAQ